MTDRTSYPPRLDPDALARAVERAGGVEVVAERLGLAPEFVLECLAGEREWPDWAGIASATHTDPPPNESTADDA